MRRLLAAIVIAALAGFVLVTSQGTRANASDPAAEADFVARINAYRASQGVGAVQPHSVLTAKAQAWAAYMAATGCLCHSNLPDGVSVRWSKLGENIGRGPSVASLNDAFINSPPHRETMVDPSFQWVGVGVAYGGGQMWVSEVFMNGDGPPRPSGDPIGSLDYAVRGPGVIGVQGWAFDPDTTAPIRVDLYVDGQGVGSTTANGARNDVAGRFPGYGPAHGFSTNIGVGPGDHTVCAYAINAAGDGHNPAVGCRFVPNTPFGALDSATPSPSGLKVSGWTIGQDIAGPLGVHFYFNGHIVAATIANRWRGDVARAYPAYGADHGFSASLPNQSGSLCAYAINGAGNGDNPALGCTFVNTNPIGNLDGATRTARGVRVRGWSVDPDTSADVPVHIYVDGRPVVQIRADDSRLDIAAAFQAYGSSHAFNAVVPLGPGPHGVCAYAINQATGFANPLLGCRIVG